MRCREARGVLLVYTWAMWDGGKVWVKTVERNSKHVPVLIGLQQGLVLSPFYLPR